MSVPSTEASLTWRGGTLFEAESASGERLRIDVPIAKGGSGAGFSPMTLLLHALGTCLATTLVQILVKQRLTVEAYRLTLRGERAAERPHPYTHVVVEHALRGRGLTRPNLERLVALVEERYCSVAATLPRGLIEHRIVLADEPPAAEEARDGVPARATSADSR
jgi:putative redox protein